MRAGLEIAMAIGIYAASQVLRQARGGYNITSCSALMRLHARQGLRGSKANKILRDETRREDRSSVD